MNIGFNSGVFLSIVDTAYNVDITGDLERSFTSVFNYLYDIMYLKVFIILAVFTILFVINIIGNKMQNKVYNGFTIMISLGMIVGVSLRWTISGNIMAYYLSLAFVMTATVFILKLIRLSVTDYFVMFTCFYFVDRFAGLSPDYFGVALPILYIFIVLLAINKIRLKRLNGNLFNIWFTAMFTALAGYCFNIFFNKFVIRRGYFVESNIEKIIIWGVSTLILVALNLAVIYGIKRLFHKRFNNINLMGKLYPKIERFFIYNTIGILLIMSSFYFVCRAINGYDSPIPAIINIFTLIALVMQLSFLVMIFRITWLKDNLRNKAIENESLAVYSSNLEKNMDNIRNIKHDIKNIFLTMGNFVEQSDNIEMQNFYREKINPFANEEIAKSDLYGKLSAIDNEQLRAFLFYKISQGIKYGISLELDIPTNYTSSKIKMEFTDVVRILGILLDNAIEECIELVNGAIFIEIKQNNELVSYKIKNTISLERKEKGINLNNSSKGDGRGKGLFIARGILEKYDFATLNSYFDNDNFIQNLIIYNLEI